MTNDEGLMRVDNKELNKFTFWSARNSHFTLSCLPHNAHPLYARHSMITRRFVFDDVKVRYVGLAEFYFWSLRLFRPKTSDITQSFIAGWASKTPTSSDILYQPLTSGLLYRFKMQSLVQNLFSYAGSMAKYCKN